MVARYAKNTIDNDGYSEIFQAVPELRHSDRRWLRGWPFSPSTNFRYCRAAPRPVDFSDQNDNFSPSSPTRGAVPVERILPKFPFVSVVFGFPRTLWFSALRNSARN